MRVLIADDHAIVRRGLQLIVSKRPGWSVTEAANATELFIAIRAEPFDVVVLDLSLGDQSGIDLVRQIRAEIPDARLLMLSSYPEEQYAVRSLRAGARGFVQKDSTPEVLLEAIERVAAGRIYVSSSVAERLAADVADPSRALPPHERLSTREFEVFRFLATGRSITDIASTLHLSVKTVSTYRARILEKTGFTSNADIVAYAIRSDLI